MKNIKNLMLFTLIAVSIQPIACAQTDDRTHYAEQSERAHQFMYKLHQDGTQASKRARIYLNKIIDGNDFDAIARANNVISNTQLTFEEIRDELCEQSFNRLIWQAGPTVAIMILFSTIILCWPKK